jgi:hypothetical protein
VSSLSPQKPDFNFLQLVRHDRQMLASGPYICGAAALANWNTVRSDDLDVGHRGRFFRENSDIYAATSRKCSNFAQSLLIETHLLE